jgi:hypothetical protein
MADNPSWLQSSNAAPTPPPAEVFSLDNPTAVTGSTTSSNRAASVALTPEEEKDLPGIILIMRLANMGVAVALMTASVSFTGRSRTGRIAVTSFSYAHQVSFLCDCYHPDSCDDWFSIYI